MKCQRKQKDNEHATHGNCHCVTTEDGCQRAADPYRTAKRIALLPSATPCAVPKGVLTVGLDEPSRGHRISRTMGIGKPQSSPLAVIGIGGNGSLCNVIGDAADAAASAREKRMEPKKTMASNRIGEYNTKLPRSCTEVGGAVGSCYCWRDVRMLHEPLCRWILEGPCLQAWNTNRLVRRRWWSGTRYEGRELTSPAR